MSRFDRGGKYKELAGVVAVAVGVGVPVAVEAVAVVQGGKRMQCILLDVSCRLYLLRFGQRRGTQKEEAAVRGGGALCVRGLFMFPNIPTS